MHEWYVKFYFGPRHDPTVAREGIVHADDYIAAVHQVIDKYPEEYSDIRLDHSITKIHKA